MARNNDSVYYSNQLYQVYNIIADFLDALDTNPEIFDHLISSYSTESAFDADESVVENALDVLNYWTTVLYNENRR